MDNAEKLERFEKALAGKRELSRIEKQTFDRIKRKEINDVQKRIERDRDRNTTNNIADKLIRGLSTDISPLPAVKLPERRESTKYNLQLFNEHYFPGRFNLRWSTDHLKLIKTIEYSILHGGGYASFAFPRGSGKTSLAETSALWALLHGHRRYVVIVGATQGHSVEIFKSVMIELETNLSLLEDYPESVYPLVTLDGNHLRSKSQHIEGERTRMELKQDAFVFPFVEGSVASGSTIQCVSITGRLRGIKRTVANTGEILRPDLVIIDDPQTDRSAKSPRQVEARERTVVGAILGMAGPQTDITAIMPCTVIRSDDLAERFLDREKRPEWQGTRTKMMDSFPTNMDLWREYAELQGKSFREGNHGAEATEFYRANREAMDAGAVVTWTERYNPKTEISAIQHAMNLWIKDPVAFAAEYQNEPLIGSNEDSSKLELDPKSLISRVSGLPFGVVPRSTQFITGGVDIQQRILYYSITAWTEDFGGVIVDYGSFPRQPTDYYSATNPPETLDKALPGLLLAPQIFKGLEYLYASVFSRKFKRDETEGDELRLDKVLVDANWNMSADAVYTFCKQQEQSGIFEPSHGKGITASMLPMDSWSKKQGDRVGLNWRRRLHTVHAGRGRHILYDTNYWKSRVAERLLAGMGSSNALMLYGTNSYTHQLLADHLSAEYSVTTHGRGRDVNEWKAKVSQGENHFFDCLVMSAVAASICGLQLHDMALTADGKTTTAPPPKKVRRVLTQADFVKKKL